MDGSTLPAHLRADAEPLARCTVCSRGTWSAEELGQACAMPQPSGAICRGFFPSVKMPANLAAPDWESARKTHDWRNHVSEHVRRLWPTFTDEQKAVLFAQAEDQASAEEWD